MSSHDIPETGRRRPRAPRSKGPAPESDGEGRTTAPDLTGTPSARSIQALQRSAGNRAVQRLLALTPTPTPTAATARPEGSGTWSLQRKAWPREPEVVQRLTVGDKREPIASLGSPAGQALLRYLEEKHPAFDLADETERGLLETIVGESTHYAALSDIADQLAVRKYDDVYEERDLAGKDSSSGGSGGKKGFLSGLKTLFKSGRKAAVHGASDVLTGAKMKAGLDRGYRVESSGSSPQASLMFGAVGLGGGAGVQSGRGAESKAVVGIAKSLATPFVNAYQSAKKARRVGMIEPLRGEPQTIEILNGVSRALYGRAAIEGTVGVVKQGASATASVFLGPAGAAAVKGASAAAGMGISKLGKLLESKAAKSFSSLDQGDWEDAFVYFLNGPPQRKDWMTRFLFSLFDDGTKKREFVGLAESQPVSAATVIVAILGGEKQGGLKKLRKGQQAGREGDDEFGGEDE